MKRDTATVMIPEEWELMNTLTLPDGISVFSSESNDESTGSDEEEEGEQMAPTLPDGTSVFSSEN